MVNKPSGIHVHRTPLTRDRVFLLQQVRDQLGQLVYPVHRLDRATSGALLFAFGGEDARLLQEALRAPEARKEYLALVRGETPERFHSERPIGGREARTDFERLAFVPDARCSLIVARLSSGRRHQIRKHLNHLGHHVLGDTSHGKGKDNRYFRETYGLPRLFLHARRLTFRHPRSGALVDVVAPLAAELAEVLARLPSEGLGSLAALVG